MGFESEIADSTLTLFYRGDCGEARTPPGRTPAMSTRSQECTGVRLTVTDYDSRIGVSNEL